jgi:hypothetical protein
MKPANRHAPHPYRSQNGSLYLQHDDDDDALAEVWYYTTQIISVGSFAS